MENALQIRAYTPSDRAACLDLLGLNTPIYFALSERADYEQFLDAYEQTYSVCVKKDNVVAAFGLSGEVGADHRLSWILVHPSLHGSGVGTEIMRRVLSECQTRQATQLTIATSQKIEGFFERFGATVQNRTPGGWGPGLDRVDMTIRF